MWQNKNNSAEKNGPKFPHSNETLVSYQKCLIAVVVVVVQPVVGLNNFFPLINEIIIWKLCVCMYVYIYNLTHVIFVWYQNVFDYLK